MAERKFQTEQIDAVAILGFVLGVYCTHEVDFRN